MKKQSNVNKTKVLFRKHKQTKSIVALFPEKLSLPELNYSKFFLESDSGCVGYFTWNNNINSGFVEDMPAFIKQTEIARKFEYKNLYDIIVELGYELDVRISYTKSMKENRA